MDSKLLSIDSLRIERDRHFEPAAAPLEPMNGEAPAVAGLRLQRPWVHSLDEERRERERLLPAGGVLGATGGAYKMLRTQVLRRLGQLGANTLAVLSAVNGEGKTLTAINLAVAIAADPGHTAILVDLDLRNPSIHRRLGFEPEVDVARFQLRHRRVSAI
jgi:Mrp family chromosome partitioning ATPase